ncbi:hypothetical protein [Runella salmonicolor]|uniref:Uncharacterized protein n=1 Tax=Runella salmonicolor TaxID=2950278 RepID=A0ABT1FQ30_9BACT|nr:hypothetical protein [Runella salmonicolor]MCP1383615.1 hypothetical protein [Runella salmonicolor]
MKIIDWEKNLISIDFDKPQGSFLFKNQTYHYGYFGFKSSQMGILIIWNVLTKEAFRVSRMKIPDNIDFYDLHDEETCRQVVPEDLNFSL